MKFLSGYNIKIIVYWGEFSAGGGELPLIPSVKKNPGKDTNLVRGVYQRDWWKGMRPFSASGGLLPILLSVGESLIYIMCNSYVHMYNIYTYLYIYIYIYIYIIYIVLYIYVYFKSPPFFI